MSINIHFIPSNMNMALTERWLFECSKAISFEHSKGHQVLLAQYRIQYWDSWTHGYSTVYNSSTTRWLRNDLRTRSNPTMVLVLDGKEEQVAPHDGKQVFFVIES